MGLDMYLYAKRYLSQYNENDKKIESGVSLMFPELSANKIPVKEVSAEVGYWRKANQIHGWFVKNVQEGVDDCKPYYVSSEQLQELRALCQSVIDNPSLAEQLLPCMTGFFFGGTGYGEWYINDLKQTVEIIDHALELADDWDFWYQSSW